MKNNIEEYYETEVELNERQIEIVVNTIGMKKIDKESIQAIDNYIDNIGINEKSIRLVIHKDFEQKGEAKNYIDFQMKEQDKEDIAELIEYADKKLSKKEKLLSVIHLLRINFYPETKDKVFAMYDYTIGEELTDDLLVVKVLRNNNVEVTIES